MVESIGSASSSSIQSTTESSSVDEKTKTQEEEGLFTFDGEPEPPSDITEDTAKSTALSYIESLKAQYPQLAGKLDQYYSHLDVSVLCANASSTSDIKAFIFNETKSLM